MTYRVFINKLTGAGWIVLNATTGTTIGTYKSKKAAVTAARVLAGWRGEVVVA